MAYPIEEISYPRYCLINLLGDMALVLFMAYTI